MTFLVSLFQCLTTVSVKTIFLVSTLNLPQCSLRPFPLVLSLFTCEKRLTLLLTQLPYRQLQRAIRSSLRLLFSRLNTPTSLRPSSEGVCSSTHSQTTIWTVMVSDYFITFFTEPPNCGLAPMVTCSYLFIILSSFRYVFQESLSDRLSEEMQKGINTSCE